MKSSNRMALTGAVLVIAFVFSGSASATAIECSSDPKINYMEIDSSQVSACLASGTGNLSGNSQGANPDPFLTMVGTGYELADKSDETPDPYTLSFGQDTQKATDSTGDYSFDSAFWNDFGTGAIGFKFGTGNKRDEWFVYELQLNNASGPWKFNNAFEAGGGLSHVNLYGVRDGVTVAAPVPLLLIGVGLLAMAGVRKRANA